MYYGKDAEAYRQGYHAGTEPDETPYGFHLAKTFGYDVVFSSDAPSAPASLRARVVAKFLRAGSRRLGFDIAHAYNNRAAIRQADVIWTMTEGEAFAISLLCRLGLVPRHPLLANAIWLFDGWDELPSYKKLAFRHLSRYIDIMTVHSQQCLPIIRRQLPRLRSELMYFGVNTNVFKITSPVVRSGDGPIRIFAPGNDRTRDWGTLLRAFGNDARFEVRIICQWLDKTKLTREYSNLTILTSPVMNEFIECYRWADVVVVPMHTNTYSGITVALEGVAMGKPVLSTRTGGVLTYFDEDEVFYTPVGDHHSMRDTVLGSDERLLAERADRAQRRFLERDYSTHGLISRYAELTRPLLETSRMRS
jgi:glycosyltransferase involved in cell wall biosynthesis